MIIDRADTLNLLTLPVPGDIELARKNAAGLFVRIEIVTSLMPFLTERERAQAQAWLDRANLLREQLGGGLTWQANPTNAR